MQEKVSMTCGNFVHVHILNKPLKRVGLTHTHTITLLKSKLLSKTGSRRDLRVIREFGYCCAHSQGFNVKWTQGCLRRMLWRSLIKQVKVFILG